MILAIAIVRAGDDAVNKAPPTTAPDKAKHAPGSVTDMPPRDPKADRSLIDLTNYYTLSLNEDASGVYGYTLELLPRGVQQIGKTTYDLRGIVQLSSNVFVSRHIEFPHEVKGIKIGQKCRTLSFLHASRWIEQEGTQIGTYVVHYANGQTRDIPIRFGIDLRDWKPQHDPNANAANANGPQAAWQGVDKGGAAMVLFEFEWTNPLPDQEITAVDLVSSMTDAAPFLVGLTAQ
jgi:hypothetical protein